MNIQALDRSRSETYDFSSVPANLQGRIYALATHRQVTHV